jgi:competence protein ComEC
VPHHGSKTSSTPAFIDVVAPRLAVVQAAYRSRFGHPAAEVADRYRQRGITLVRSDACGAWTWRAGMPGAGDTPGGSAGAAGPGVCQRQVARRYWHHAVVSATGAGAGASAAPAPSNP